jgi:sterol 3beta-glucosyltransferase
MRFTVLGYGTEGDSRPIVALCKGLMDRGHDVQYLTQESSAAYATATGVPTRHLAGDLRKILSQYHLSPRESRKAIFKTVQDSKLSWMKDIAAEAVNSDAILCTRIVLPFARHVANQMDIPLIHLGLQPWAPTREFSVPILAPYRLPGWLKLMSHRLQRLADHMFDAKSVHDQVFSGPARAPSKSLEPTVYGFSRHLVPRPRDWPAKHIICGAWQGHTAAYEPPADLVTFLEAGPPPIYVGFGSGAGKYGPNVFDALIAGIGKRRALFFPGWGTFDHSRLPDNFFVVREIPHAWLFPRTSMVIHHGGAGTTHTAAQAGVPSIVVPAGLDQPFWALRLHAAGVAPRYVENSKLTATHVSAMIEFASMPEVRERARALGLAIAQEDGVGTAAVAIEEMIAHWRPEGAPVVDDSVAGMRMRMLAS